MKTRTIVRGVRRGFTLLEMMMVMVLIGVIMGIVGWNLFAQGDAAKRKASIASMHQVEAMITQYQMEYNALPTSLDLLVPKYTPKKPTDGWKREIHYVPGTAGGAHPYQLFSTGPSGEVGGTDNIDYWTADEAPASGT